MIGHKRIRIPKTAHYYTLGKFSEDTKYVWLVCHGYGQAADRFITKFEVLDLKANHIIAPEGLSRFYWGGMSGHVVASWMTRKDRLDEIEDHINLLHETIKEWYGKEVTLVFFGFSQGCATILRYLERFQPQNRQIILWAGSIPKDLNFSVMAPYLGASDIHLIYGNKDEFLTTEVLAEELEFIYRQDIPLKLHEYEGTHRVDKEVLRSYVTENF
jgi:predicted esterase